MDTQKQLVKTARITGIWYLLMAISGVLGFLYFHPKVFISGDAVATLQNIIDGESIVRIRLLLEFTIIFSQVLTAVWFYKLFRPINEWAAWSIAVWGTVNAVAIMISAIAMASTIDISVATMAMDEQVLLISVLQSIMKHAWAAGSIFFGLWLIPMGYVVTSSQRMPIWLGYTLIIGGIGYILSTLLYYAGMEGAVVDFLTIPATIGEFWMIGYLLIFGIRPLTVINE